MAPTGPSRPRAGISRSLLRDLLLVALAVTTGATDSTTFLALGHVFSSVITGNLVLLGVGAAHADAALLRSAGIALVAYAAGVGVVAPWLKPAITDVAWPRRANRALIGELVVLAGFAILWELSTNPPPALARDALLALAAIAMGMQSETVRSLGPFSTTYLTSTLTGVIGGLVRGEVTPEIQRGMAIVATAVAAAAAAAGLLSAARDAVPALQCGPLLVVVCLAPSVGDEDEPR